MIQTLINILFIFGLSIIAHEFGHWLFFRLEKKKSVPIIIYTNPLKIKVGELKDYKGFTNTDFYFLSAFGIVLGLLPLTLLEFINISLPIRAGIVILYLIGCKTDFKLLWLNKK